MEVSLIIHAHIFEAEVLFELHTCNWDGPCTFQAVIEGQGLEILLVYLSLILGYSNRSTMYLAILQKLASPVLRTSQIGDSSDIASILTSLSCIPVMIS